MAGSDPGQAALHALQNSTNKHNNWVRLCIVCMRWMTSWYSRREVMQQVTVEGKTAHAPVTIFWIFYCAVLQNNPYDVPGPLGLDDIEALIYGKPQYVISSICLKCFTLCSHCICPWAMYVLLFPISQCLAPSCQWNRNMKDALGEKHTRASG